MKAQWIHLGNSLSEFYIEWSDITNILIQLLEHLPKKLEFGEMKLLIKNGSNKLITINGIKIISKMYPYINVSDLSFSLQELTNEDNSFWAPKICGEGYSC